MLKRRDRDKSFDFVLEEKLKLREPIIIKEKVYIEKCSEEENNIPKQVFWSSTQW